MGSDTRRQSGPLDQAQEPCFGGSLMGDWLALMAVLELLPAALDAQLKRDAGMNHFEYMILAGLSDAPDRMMPMSQLAKFAAGSLSRLSHALGRMESKGWVTRTPTGCGRAVDVELTSAGVRAIRDASPGHLSEARRLVVDVLGPKGLADLGAHCRTILDTIDPRYKAMIDELAGRGQGGPGSPDGPVVRPLLADSTAKLV